MAGRGDHGLRHVIECALRRSPGGGRQGGGAVRRSAGVGQQLRRRARQDDLAPEPGDRRGGRGHGRQGGRHLQAGVVLERCPYAGHVRDRVPAVDSGAVVDGGLATATATGEGVDIDALAAELRSICGPEHTLTHHDQLRTYESDGLLQYAAMPGVVVLPSTGEEVRRCVEACHRAGAPFVARGSGSGLSGGAMPVEGGALIALSRLRRILEVDLENQRVVCEPGVTNIAVSHAVAPDFFYPPDPSSQIVCSIGGNVAENSGGAHCFKYGFTTNYVTGLEVVLADGQMLELGGREADLPGYDLIGAFVGSEGTLGIATKIWLRVVPKPESVRTLVAFFDSTIQAGEVVSEIVSAGMVPGAIEMMDNLSIRAAEGATGAGYPEDAGAALVVELDGSEAECETLFDEVKRICDGQGANSIRVAQDE